MQKPVIFNRYLTRKWKDEENSKMACKLGMVKPVINLKCPESYTTFKTLKKDRQLVSLFRDFEIIKDNRLMAKKINDINSSRSPMLARTVKCFTRSLEKNKVKSEKEKWKMFKITQENQSMLRRLHEAQPVYEFKKFENDYNKSMYYKSHICEYEVKLPWSGLKGGFNGTGYGSIGGGTTTYGKSKNSTQTGFRQGRITLDKIKNSNSPENDIKNNKDFKTNEIKDLIKYQKGNQMVLFYKSFFFQDLLKCELKCYLENKKFVIRIKPQNTDDCYYLVFMNPEEIQKMKSLYKNYEDIVTDLDHNVHSDLVLVKNQKFKSIYV